ncbi:MAG: amphi-Trp domain-containing protein [candidate division Zixibacteria bacterium]|nr:amphi-Trp domain-containing protein [candidate division Zixibacteria bacterium]
MSQSQDFFYESVQDPKTIKDFLQSLMEGIEKGNIALSSNGEEIVLNPSDMLKFSVKAKVKGEASKLSLKISWKEAKKVNIEVEDNLEIKSK